MRGVVDANVLSYYLLRSEPFAEALSSFLPKTTDLLAPDLWRAELLNVLWMAVRHQRVPEETAGRLFRTAERLITRTVAASGLWRSALRLSCERAHPVYDTLYVALAQREKVPLWTYDKGILKCFPDVAERPGE